MSELRYHTDEHVARAVIRGLRQRGVDVLTVAEADMMGVTDEAHYIPLHQTHSPEICAT